MQVFRMLLVQPAGQTHLLFSDPHKGRPCRALAGVLPQEQLQAVLRKLCKELVDALDVTTPASVRCVPAAMQALSSIGRLAPDIFAEHAASVADFVLGVRLWQALLRNIDVPLDKDCLSARQDGASSTCCPILQTNNMVPPC